MSRSATEILDILASHIRPFLNTVDEQIDTVDALARLTGILAYEFGGPEYVNTVIDVIRETAKDIEMMDVLDDGDFDQRAQ
jgi:hypothetical protein